MRLRRGRGDRDWARRRASVIRVTALLVALSSFVFLPGPHVGAALPTRPNLILIMLDDLRAADLYYLPTTRSLLGGHGVTFTNSFVSAPLCCPARSEILTGQYSHNTGVYDNEGPNGGVAAFNDDSTLATWLKGAGYRTSLIGKYFNNYEYLAESFIPPGWDDWHVFATGSQYPYYYNYTLNENGVLNHFNSDPANYMTTMLGRRAVSFIKSSTASPFFLALWPLAPHTPAVPGPGDAASTLPLPKPPSFNEADVSDKPWGSTAPLLTADQIQWATTYWQNALGTLKAADRVVAAVVQVLQDLGQLENTVIAFTSDNGVMLGDHRLIQKTWAYEASVRVPLVFRLPGATKARYDNRFVLNMDIAPTFAELAGVTPPLKQNAVSLVRLLENQPGVKWRKGVFLEFRGSTPAAMKSPPYQAFRTSDYKLIIYDNGWRELYDMKKDPHELNNLANDPAYDAAEAQVEVLLRQHASS